MQTASYVEALLSDLTELAELGPEGSETARAARSLSRPLAMAAGQRLLEALGEIALEVSAQIPTGHVEVRLAGQDADLVFVEDRNQPASGTSGEEQPARITLRLPDALKAGIDRAAAAEAVSVNSWLVRTLQRAVSTPRPQGHNHLRGYAQS